MDLMKEDQGGPQRACFQHRPLQAIEHTAIMTYIPPTPTSPKVLDSKLMPHTPKQAFCMQQPKFL